MIRARLEHVKKQKHLAAQVLAITGRIATYILIYIHPTKFMGHCVVKYSTEMGYRTMLEIALVFARRMLVTSLATTILIAPAELRVVAQVASQLIETQVIRCFAW